VEVVPLRSGKRLRRVKGSLAEIERLAPELGGGFLRVEVSSPPSPGLADKVRELLPNAVDVVIADRAKAPELPEKPRNGRSPRDLFADYLKEKDANDARVRALFDELLDEIHAPE
jgi:exonuclease SbcD